jgi:hypothetical protein
MSLILSGTEGISGSAGVIDAETFAGQANTYYTDISARLGYTPLSNVNPSYSGTLTGNTGIINIGSGQFYKDANGQIGIGTTSPQAPLNVSYSNSTRTDTLRLTNRNTGGYGSWLNFYGDYDGGYSFAKIGTENETTGATLRFHTADTSKVSQERMRLDSSGNLGLGTNSPSTFGKFAVTGTLGTFAVEASGAVIKMTRSNTNYITCPNGDLSYNATLHIFTNANASTEWMRINSSGNVGIGTSSPTARLHVAGGGLLGTSSTNPLAFTGSSSSLAGIGSYNANTDMNIYAAGTGNIKFSSGVSWSSDASLTDIGTERMRIDSSGNVGIGTASPADKLDVVGPVRNTGAYRSITGGVDAIFGANQFATGVVGLGSVSNHPITFNTNLTERMRINSSGNVGIGTPNTPVEVTLALSSNLGWEQTSTSTIANIFRQSSSAALILGSGVKYSATANGFLSSYASPWARSAIAVGYGVITFNVAAEATVAIGTDTTVNERMRITSVGDVCVNTQSLIGSGLLSLISPSNRNGVVSRAGDNANYTFAGQNTGGTTTFFVTGAGALSATSITETSSIAYKENVNPIMQALDAIVQLTGVTYDRKDGSRTNEAGLIAEEVNKVLPNIVTKNDEGNPEGIQYTKLTAYLIECIKELKSEIDILKGK